MRLVFQFTEGDGCTYSATHTHPVEYESAEALLVQFMQAAQAARASLDNRFEFLGVEFDASCFFEEVGQAYKERFRGNATFLHVGQRVFMETAPQVWTVDEWFAQSEMAGGNAASLPRTPAG